MKSTTSLTLLFILLFVANFHGYDSSLSQSSLLDTLEQQVELLKTKYANLKQKFNICKANFTRLNYEEKFNYTLDLLDDGNEMDPYGAGLFTVIKFQIAMLRNEQKTESAPAIAELKTLFENSLQNEFGKFYKSQEANNEMLANQIENGIQSNKKELVEHRNQMSEVISQFTKRNLIAANSIVESTNSAEKVQNILEPSTSTINSCAEALNTPTTSNIYELRTLWNPNVTLKVACDNEYEGGGWLVIQRRIDGTTDFERNWEEYKHGFGNRMAEFWLGLEPLRQLTANRRHELLIAIKFFDSTNIVIKYDNFEIGDEQSSFKLTSLGLASGNGGDYLLSNRNMKFSTFDRDNDDCKSHNCARIKKGGWWFSCCGFDLNAPYPKYQNDTDVLKWGQRHIIKFVQMMIRPKASIQ